MDTTKLQWIGRKYMSKLTIEQHTNDMKATVATLDLDNQLSSEFLMQGLICVRLFDKKQSDYGPNNIGKFGYNGVLVRMSDKFERLCTLSRSGREPAVINEPIEDTLRDIANYAIIAIMCRNGTWPK